MRNNGKWARHDEKTPPAERSNMCHLLYIVPKYETFSHNALSSIYVLQQWVSVFYEQGIIIMLNNCLTKLKNVMTSHCRVQSYPWPTTSLFNPNCNFLNLRMVSEMNLASNSCSISEILYTSQAWIPLFWTFKGSDLLGTYYEIGPTIQM